MDYCADCYKTKEILDSVVGFFPIDSMLCMTCNKKVDHTIPKENPFTKDTLSPKGQVECNSKPQVIVRDIIKN